MNSKVVFIILYIDIILYHRSIKVSLPLPSKYLKYKVSAHGIPDDHIIVMMYDDIANNEENPTPGTVIAMIIIIIAIIMKTMIMIIMIITS